MLMRESVTRMIGAFDSYWSGYIEPGLDYAVWNLCFFEPGLN
jgi:hypothetical protein